ncbi:MAG: acyl carrier protein [Coriobacteriia bacterium]|nr:acyl carrier protein [Coriobacteriia bacterium]MCL2745592.1 acyl carrier protein [Coriobacteriia bacterium]MCL2870557.1 acyl carrier protein [Coriobacteriia bacterium]
MDRNEVIGRIKEVVVEQLGANEEAVVETATFIEDLGADSLDLVEIVMAFEDEFETSIPDTALEKIKTVGDAADFILSNA